MARTFEIIVIGTSLGGFDALKVLLSGLPRSFPIPVVVVQHRHKSSHDTFLPFLQQYAALPLKEVEDKEVILPGWVYLAPADYHLLIEPWQSQGNYPYFALSTEAPVLHARPSIDVLFESAADAYAERVVGVILTGASRDGVRGLGKIKACGGLTVVENPSTAESRIMPEAAIATVAVDYILLLQDIAPFLVNLCQRMLR